MSVLTDVKMVEIGSTDDYVPYIPEAPGDNRIEGIACYRKNGKFIPYRYSILVGPQAEACLRYINAVRLEHPEWDQAIAEYLGAKSIK